MLKFILGSHYLRESPYTSKSGAYSFWSTGMQFWLKTPRNRRRNSFRVRSCMYSCGLYLAAMRYLAIFY